MNRKTKLTRPLDDELHRHLTKLAHEIIDDESVARTRLQSLTVADVMIAAMEEGLIRWKNHAKREADAWIDRERQRLDAETADIYLDIDAVSLDDVRPNHEE